MDPCFLAVTLTAGGGISAETLWCIVELTKVWSKLTNCRGKKDEALKQPTDLYGIMLSGL